MLSETVLVLERSLAGANMRVLRKVNSIPKSNSDHPSTSRSTSTSKKRMNVHPQKYLKNHYLRSGMASMSSWGSISK
ncbi:MAG: hypothetical protein ACOVNQ_03735, partial [Pirellula sp.]